MISSSWREYCEQTSLHGWFYIGSDKSIWRIIWLLIVAASIGIASIFIYEAVEDFTKSTVVTTIYSTTVPLSEVYFPAVTICNINQVRKSFFNDLNINNNRTIVDLLYQQFYTGSKNFPNPDEAEFIRNLFKSETYVKSEYQYHCLTQRGSCSQSQLANWTAYFEKYGEWIQKGFQFTRLAVQEPYGVMILRASYGTKKRYGNSTDFNPYFGTDYGICSIIKPQTVFNSKYDSIPYWDKLFGKINWSIQKGAQVGKANGLSILLDAETFDYTFHLKAGEGFKIAVHHHLDQPIMSIKELDISPGSVFQIAVTPILMSTTEEARYRLYRYEMSNCLFEAGYEKILEECNCTPSFHQLANKEVPQICSGPGLTCMNRNLRYIGKLNKVGKNQDECLSACDDQINSVSVTSSDFPNRETFSKREEFCLALLKLVRTCNSRKKIFLTEKFPTVCDNIKLVSNKSGVRDSHLCQNRNIWEPNRELGLSTNDTAVFNLEENIFQYAKKNLAVVNVYIKDPVVTNIQRDQKIPIIAFRC
ncbi:ASICN [Lepeophtheirus salmonis]|uniref:ASICN n=1 Tax=Lepeophtheirus salmonis TaxID=72036 RepID=A0A7R8D229_LEPSM|nr:ASICN [Lepeophtheirus salmonis]CAF3001594.1 ASICN [Lepeophtheirus salmonis]